MKNFIFVTASSLALIIAAEANAQGMDSSGAPSTAPSTPMEQAPNSKMMGLQPAPSTPPIPTEQNAATSQTTPSTSAAPMEQMPDSKMMDLQPAPSTPSTSMEQNPAPSQTPPSTPSTSMEQNAAPSQTSPSAIKGVSYKDGQKQQGSALSYYLGNHEYPYKKDGGYFWYPHAQGNILAGYNPHYDNKMFWYASHMNPHTVYVDKTPVDFVYPHPMDRQLYNSQAAPMKKKWDSAPDIQTSEGY